MSIGVRLLSLLLFLACLLSFGALADIGNADPSACYENALNYVMLDRYEEAKAYFEKAGDNYKQSLYWKLYCESILKVSPDAPLEDLQRLKERFGVLEAVPIAHEKWQPEKWHCYCEARCYEAKGFTELAMKGYQELGDFQDSFIRNYSLQKKKYEAADRVRYDGWLVTSKYAVVRTGPGKEYSEGETSDTWEASRNRVDKIRVDVLEKVGYWYLIEYTVDSKPTRGYVAQNRLVDVAIGVPSVEEKMMDTSVVNGAPAVYAGPGDFYHVRSECILSGTVIRIFGKEDGYQLIEYKDSKGNIIRGWIKEAE